MATRILVIEDNPTNLQLITYLLSAYGYTVLTAIDGEEGLEAAHREPPDLIICDVQLPKLDGYEVARRLKSHPALRTIPLVAVTAMAMVGDRERVLAAGFDGYVAKPVIPQSFVQEVELFLGSSRPPPSPPEASSVPQRPLSRGMTILVVDNTATNRRLMLSLLEPLGYEVSIAGNVEDGLALARQMHPDLILSDIHMPGQNGYDFLKAAKADPQLRSIPFIFLSSTFNSHRDRELAHSMGATKPIMRPVEPLVLATEIETCRVKHRPSS
jgi:two-component system cell cycle response regulator